MTCVLVTYADAKYQPRQRQLADKAAANGMASISYTREQIEQTKFYQDHRHILDQPRGNGYWLWKPYIILDAMNQVNDDDVIFYQDCGDDFDPDTVKNIKLQPGQPCLLVNANMHPHTWWCKRDCFHYMDCDNETYYNTYQTEAGVNFWSNNSNSRNIAGTWLQYCTDVRLISDDPNTCGLDNLPEFIDHRHDQAILHNLSIKYQLPVDREIWQRFEWNNHRIN
jgi:hypothetical protein